MFYVKVVLAELWFPIIIAAFFGSRPEIAFMKHWAIALAAAAVWLLGHAVSWKWPLSFPGIVLIAIGLAGMSLALLTRELVGSTVLSYPFGLLTVPTLLLFLYTPPE